MSLESHASSEMTKWEGSYLWVAAWSLLPMAYWIKKFIGTPLALVLVVLLIGVTGALESGQQTRAVKFAIWGTAALLGLKILILGAEMNRFPWMFCGVGLIGAIGELFGSSPFTGRRLLHAAAGGIAFAVGGYLTAFALMFLLAPITDLPFLGDYQFMVKVPFAGLVGGVAAEAIRSIPRPARTPPEPGGTLAA